MELKAAAPLFGGAALDLFAAWLDRLLLPVSCQGAVAKDFASAGYRQAPHLLNLLTEHAAEIADRASSALCGAGVGLTEDQSVLASEILRSARAHDGTVYIVEGGPGSGKTLLAVSLLLQGASCNVRTGLAIRNNRLQAVLRRCLDQTLPGLSGLMMFFETRQGKGVGDAGFNAQFDLLICDEAQRMRRPSIPTALGRSPVTAIFLDESQRLNPPEEGTAVSFSGAARALGRTVTRRSLPTAIRCAGGQAYSDWVDLLLSDPERALRTPRPWADRYVFESRGSFGDMKLRLQFLMQSRPGSRAALVASFTEAPGYLTDPGHPDNRRIGFPLTSGWDGYAGGEEEARWLMQPTEYVKFWMRGQSSNLDRVASIYGAQGFETDFCGVVWGRDLVLRHGKWALGDPGVCFDEVDRLVRDRRTRWDEAALDLVKNRYRVFLTRGIGGTVVIFEDADTRAHVKAFLEAVTG